VGEGLDDPLLFSVGSSSGDDQVDELLMVGDGKIPVGVFLVGDDFPGHV
jgi:hypothetical protein